MRHECFRGLLYGVVIQNGHTYNEVAYNEIKNVEKKGISGGSIGHGYSDIHNNLVYWTGGYTDQIDHGIVIGGHDHKIYNNIVWTDTDTGGYAIKFDGESGGADCYGGQIYNNLILRWGIGIGVMDCQGSTLIANNTIYNQNAGSIGSTSASGKHGIAVSVGGGGATPNTIVRNNIIYYPAIGASYAHMLYLNGSCTNTTITNNLFYHSGNNERFRVGGTSALTMSYMENTWSGSGGNLFQNNIIANPSFSGGVHTVSNLPYAGFNINGYPVRSGLSILANSVAVSSGYNMSAYFNKDILGVSRPQGSAWDIGAYEYGGTTPTPTTGLCHLLTSSNSTPQGYGAHPTMY